MSLQAVSWNSRRPSQALYRKQIPPFRFRNVAQSQPFYFQTYRHALEAFHHLLVPELLAGLNQALQANNLPLLPMPGEALTEAVVQNVLPSLKAMNNGTSRQRVKESFLMEMEDLTIEGEPTSQNILQVVQTEIKKGWESPQRIAEELGFQSANPTWDAMLKALALTNILLAAFHVSETAQGRQMVFVIQPDSGG